MAGPAGWEADGVSGVLTENVRGEIECLSAKAQRGPGMRPEQTGPPAAPMPLTIVK